MKFSELGIDSRILKALSEMHFVEMTDIQEKSLPLAMKGKDIIAQAMTGSGKTAVFGVPIIQKMQPRGGVQALVLTPTRELCNQVANELQKFSRYCNLHVAAVYGGVSIEPQIHRIGYSEIVVGTPGRILDHMQRGTLQLKGVKILVLDEADRMLDMGFIDDIRKIISFVPQNRQTMLFSATMPEEILQIAKRYMRSPLHIRTQLHISRHLLKHVYYDVRRDEKPSLLAYLIEKERPSLALVFTATRRAADFVNRYLQSQGVESRAIHGGHSQFARENILAGFHRGRPHILVATDVAARGLDIKNISHVFNYDIPKSAEDYTHRIGRTARFGKTGKAISLLSREDHPFFQKIMQKIHIEKGHLEGFRPKPVAFREHGEHMRRGEYDMRRRRGPRRRWGLRAER